MGGKGGEIPLLSFFAYPHNGENDSWCTEASSSFIETQRAFLSQKEQSPKPCKRRAGKCMSGRWCRHPRRAWVAPLPEPYACFPSPLFALATLPSCAPFLSAALKREKGSEKPQKKKRGMHEGHNTAPSPPENHRKYHIFSLQHFITTIRRFEPFLLLVPLARQQQSESSPMSGKSSKQRRYEASWLPPFSLPSLVGVILFVTYVGSATWNSMPFRVGPTRLAAIQAPWSNQEGAMSPLWWSENKEAGTGESDALESMRGDQQGETQAAEEEEQKSETVYDSEEEAEFCSRAKTMEYDACFKPIRPTNKTIYMVPYGGLGNRLRAVASAFNAAREVGAKATIVWREKEWGFRGSWNELFDEPRIPIGCLPGEVVREVLAECKIHHINSVEEWDDVKDRFEYRPDGSQVLCVRSMMFLTKSQRDIAWFMKLLVPAETITRAMEVFKQSVKWNEWGSWIGMHVRRSDLKLKCTSFNCKTGIYAADTLALDRYVDLVKNLAALKSPHRPRVFIATDDPSAEMELRDKLTKSLNLTLDRLDVVSYSKSVRSSDALETRSRVDGTKEAIIDMWLLSQTPILIGTTGSTYSQAARLIGDHFFTSVGVEYENRDNN